MRQISGALMKVVFWFSIFPCGKFVGRYITQLPENTEFGLAASDQWEVTCNYFTVTCEEQPSSASSCRKPSSSPVQGALGSPAPLSCLCGPESLDELRVCPAGPRGWGTPSWNSHSLRNTFTSWYKTTQTLAFQTMDVSLTQVFLIFQQSHSWKAKKAEPREQARHRSPSEAQKPHEK